MSVIPAVYWDTSCFISLLSADIEPDRAGICIDVLNHAKDDRIKIWTSCWTIVETIRPREPFVAKALPNWAVCLDQTDKDGKAIYPGSRTELEKIWEYFHRNTRSTRILEPDKAKKIRQMFAWSWIRKIQVVPTIAAEAAELARNYNLRPPDALHIASALARGCESIHCWDRDFRRTDHMIPSQAPVRLSPTNLFLP